MTKQETIKEAYGIYCDKFKGFIDENRWLNCKEKQMGLAPYFDVYEIQSSKVKQRPKSIQGISGNNGWIKIRSEDDLQGCIECFFLTKDEGVLFGVFDNNTTPKFYHYIRRLSITLPRL